MVKDKQREWLHDDHPTNAFTKLQLENWNLKISLNYLQI